MRNINRNSNPIGARGERLNKLEAIVQRGLDTYLEVGNALAAIRPRRPHRDSLQTRRKGPPALPELWAQALKELDGDDVTGAEIRITVHRRLHPNDPLPELTLNPGSDTRVETPELLPQLRWLMSQSSGTVADVAHRLEIHAADVDERAREQLRDDVLALDEELAVLKAVLLPPVDWDAEGERLFAGEIPPFEQDTEDEGDEDDE